MAKTVTVQAARPGTTSVQVAGRAFPVGEAVRDVPDDAIEQLKAMPGVTVHVTGGKRDTTEKED